MFKVYTTMFWFSVVLVVASVFTVAVYGLNFGVDFKGGSVMEFEFNLPTGEEKPDLGSIKNKLTETDLTEIALNYTGESGIILRTKELSENDHRSITLILQDIFPGVEEKKFESIGPTIGGELKRKSVIAIILVLSAVIIYIALVFRKLFKTLSPWVMGFAAIAALLHDVVIPLGIFSGLGYFYGVEIGAVFVAAALTILGYSVADTVVVFDRIRENVIRNSRMDSDGFSLVVHKSVMQTLTRSLNTTFTTLLSLFAIYFFGGESIRYFALALIIGIFLGAYSSIFVASPILMWFSYRRK